MVEEGGINREIRGERRCVERWKNGGRGKELTDKYVERGDVETERENTLGAHLSLTFCRISNTPCPRFIVHLVIGRILRN